ncbi:MAG: hypothetical protein IGS23_05865 [Rivularia sp. T60_A2020_040]|nr:hypothetical protein [Rivularia sp. T60_A2020_040]
MYYYPTQPPYLVLFIGFFIAITSGAALAGTLKVITQTWQKNGAEASAPRFSYKQLVIPFTGITLGIGLFLCSGLAIFGFPNWLACAVGLPITLLTCILTGFQLGSMMTYAESRGFQSFDLDSFN